MLERSQQVNSLLVHLEYAKGIEASDALEKLLAHPDALKESVSIVLQRTKAGVYFLDDLIASLVGQTQNKELYKVAHDRFLRNPRTLLILYKSRYPDPEIEAKLREKLYEVFSNDSEPLRSEIVEAMQDVGSTAVVPLLEAVLSELQPSVQVRTAFFESLGFVGGLEARSRSEFIEKVRLALSNIKG